MQIHGVNDEVFPDYLELRARLRRLATLSGVSGLLGWDEQVNLPPGAALKRGEQMGLLAELFHAEQTDPALGRALAACERQIELGGLAGDVVRVVETARSDFERAVRIPAGMAAEKARLCSEGYHVWLEARAQKNFARFAPVLERHLELARREAGLLGFGEKPYDLALDRHDPGVTEARVAELFGRLREGLVPWVRSLAKRKVHGVSLPKECDLDGQRRLVAKVLKRLGFDFDRGRLDVSVHPFCEGSGSDVRLTTRYSAERPLDALLGAVHEAGHGMYEQGLPETEAGTALGMAAGMAVHESQSRLWENQVARSRAFWRWCGPEFRKEFPSCAGESLEDEALFAAVNAIEPGGLIRVEADEVHYNLHVLLRFEIERRLFNGSLSIVDLPQAWDDLAEDLLGRRPSDCAEGVLQDVHWSGGAFGYFPSYTLGNMLAAQLWVAVKEKFPSLENDFSRGEFGRLRDWLRVEVHSRGRRENLFDLTRRVCGAELDAAPLLAYLRERHGT